MSTAKTYKLTVFVGIYNGEKYLASLQSQILSQSFQDFQLIVIDNASTDGSWEVLSQWQEVFGERLIIRRNETNLGGGGSFVSALNAGLIQSQWFTSMHQDDFYFEGHLEKLVTTIQNSSDDVVAVCTGMASMNDEAKEIPSPPRASWLINDHSAPSSFLINLRTQTLSFPSAAFKTDAFSKCFRYWHSPTFLDTETTLMLCGHGEFRYVCEETMRYRENPQSESHVTNSLEALFGASIGLSRVFASEEFRTVLGKVNREERGIFYSELMSSIEIRIRESTLLYLVKILASEACANAWEYKESQSSNLLIDYYQGIDSRFAPTLLSNLSGEQIVKPEDSLRDALRALSGNLAQEIFIRHSRKRSQVNFIFAKLPLVFRIRLFRVYVRVFAIKQPNHYWNAFWK